MALPYHGRVNRPGVLLCVASLFLATTCTPSRPTIPETEPTTLPSPSATPVLLEPDPACPNPTGGEPTRAYLRSVSVTEKDGRDEIVFQFETAQDSPGGVPEFQLARAAPPFRTAGEGREMDVKGHLFYELVFHGASGANVEGEEVVITYRGPKEFKPEYEVLTEMEQSGDFEATLSWVLGLDQPSCPKLTTAESPPSLTIELPH